MNHKFLLYQALYLLLGAPPTKLSGAVCHFSSFQAYLIIVHCVKNLKVCVKHIISKHAELFSPY